MHTLKLSLISSGIFKNCILMTTKDWSFCDQHCVKCVQIRSFFWSVFSRIWTKYREILRFQSECGKIRTRKKLRIWTLVTQCKFCRLQLFYIKSLKIISSFFSTLILFFFLPNYFLLWCSTQPWLSKESQYSNCHAKRHFDVFLSTHPPTTSEKVKRWTHNIYKPFSDQGYIKNVLLLDFKRCHILPRQRFGIKTLSAKHCDSEPVLFQTKNTAREMIQRNREKTSLKHVQIQKSSLHFNVIECKHCMGIFYC